MPPAGRRLQAASLLGLALAVAMGGVGALAPLAVHATSTFNVVAYGADPSGVRDSARGIQRAIDAAQAAGPGNTVYIPTGTYQLLQQIRNPSSLEVSGSVPVTLRGDGGDRSILIEGRGKNALSVQADGTVVTGLQLDTQTHNERAALVVSANNTLLSNSTIKGGDHTFAVFYPGPPGASRTNLVYNTGNQIRGVTVNDRWSLDGFSFSFQKNGHIQNVDHTGSRLALFIDQDVVVDNEHYHPGSQAHGTQGFWITSPSNNVTINGFVTDGNGGTIGSGGQPSTNIAINNEVFRQPGFRLSIGEVDGLVINGCNFGANSMLRFQTIHRATAVVVKNCTLPVVRFTHPTTGTIQAEFDNNVYPSFTPAPREGAQTFLNANASPTDFTVKGGTLQNCAGGLFMGRGTTFAVSNLAGYPCTVDSPPSAVLSVSPSPTSALTVNADASASTDGDATRIADYQFDWGDGTITPRLPSAAQSHLYGASGTYTVSVAVIDSAGLFATAAQQITLSVGPNLVGNPGFEADTSGWVAGAGTVLDRSSTAHTGLFSAQLTSTSSGGRALMADSPGWNTNTVAGATCTLSAWVQGPGGVRLTLRARELHVGTVVSEHVQSAVTTAGTWAQLTVSAPILSSGDTLAMALYASLGTGQAMLVDDVSESC